MYKYLYYFKQICDGPCRGEGAIGGRAAAAGGRQLLAARGVVAGQGRGGVGRSTAGREGGERALELERFV